MTTWLLVLALVGMTYAYWRSKRSLRQANNHLDLLAEGNALDAVIRYQRIMKSSAGGVGKRLSECREITESILRHSPELFTKEDGLLYWLEATDQFLSELYEVYREDPDPVQDHCAAARSTAVYQAAHDKTGLPLPPGRVFSTTSRRN